MLARASGDDLMFSSSIFRYNKHQQYMSVTRTCSGCYVQLDLAVKVPLDVLCSLRMTDPSSFPEKEPSLPVLSQGGCQREQMEERSVSAHSNG